MTIKNFEVPKISVILPVYNGAEYLEEAIDSILIQTYANFELIILNDGSTDCTEKIILSYKDPRIVYIKNYQNVGLIKTLNIGLEIAKGEFIARMDSDDLANPTRFEKQLEIFQKKTEIGVCGTWLTYFGSSREHRLVRVPEMNEIIKIGLLGSNQFGHPTVMLRKSIINDSRYDEEFPAAEDYELWTRLSRVTEFYNIQESLLQYRVHKTNISVTDSELQSKTATKIIGRQLKYIGLEDSNDNIKSCTFLFSNAIPHLASADLIEIIKFANKFEKQNDKVQFYNDKILKETISNNLYLLFDRAIKYRLIIIPFLFRNRIKVLTGRNWWENLKLFSKIILKK